YPSELSQGKARLVGIAPAMGGHSALLLLDEPAAGLGADERQELGQAVRHLAESRGIGILLVEHDIAMVMSICARMAVLDFGRWIAEGSPAEVSADEAVIRAYLGEEVDDPGSS